MSKLDGRLPSVRIEIVTSTFVASGVPEGIHDLGRFLENLNNTTMARQITLRTPAIRPLYRAQAQVELEAPLLVRRDEIIFANFEGPHFTHGVVQPARSDIAVLLMAPPFQIQGDISLARDAESTPALQALLQGFFVMRHALVYDADGNALGEGEQIVVNGAAVQMGSASHRRIEPVSAAPARVERVLSTIEADALPEEPAKRAA